VKIFGLARASQGIVRRSICVLSLLIVAATSRPADACINGTLRVAEDGWTWETQKAEKALALNDPVGAAQRAFELFPELTGDRVPPERGDLFERARRILALAVARTDGTVLGAAMPRDAALAWAAKILRVRLDLDPTSPTRKSDLAEVLARLPSGRQTAYGLLAELAREDLMPEPRGWALLGALAATFGHGEVARIADTHCRQLASQAQICTIIPLA
jgi:hypothetical protein